MTLADIRSLQGAFTRIDSKAWGLAPLQLCAVRVEPGSLSADLKGHGDLRSIFAAAGCQGWVRFRSKVFASGPGAFPDFDEAGPPLAAEWTHGGDRSTHLRPGPTPGHLDLTTYQERRLDGAADEIADDEIAVMREVVTVLRHPLAKRAKGRQPGLVYHVYWGAPDADPSALGRQFSRFAGFNDQLAGRAP